LSETARACGPVLLRLSRLRRVIEIDRDLSGIYDFLRIYLIMVYLFRDKRRLRSKTHFPAARV